MVPLFGAAYAAPNKDTTILYCFRSPMTVLNTPVNGKIQGLFKIFECFSSIFQGKFNFQGLFKTVLYIQVLFKPAQTLYGVCAMGKNRGNPNQVCMKFKGTTGISSQNVFISHKYLSPFILMDFPIQIDTIRMALSIIYDKLHGWIQMGGGGQGAWTPRENHEWV